MSSPIRRQVRRPHPLLRRCADLILAAVIGAAPLPGQQAAWSFRQSPMMDLWFHAVATVGFDRAAPLPLYQAGYGDRVRQQREWRGMDPTPLDRARDTFLAAFRRDSAFEVLHFLPLYFAAADREAMLSALGQVASHGMGAVPELEPATRFGAAATAQTLGPAHRLRDLGAFTAAVTAEWNAAYAAEWRTLAATGAPIVREAEQRWRSRFAAALQPFLHRYRLDGGVIFAVPNLGPDRRIFEGAPRNRDDNIVVVALPANGDPDGVLFETLRELCFPAVRQVVKDRRPGEGEQASSDAAVRCGDLLLARYLQTERESYRRFWLTQLGAPPGLGLEAAFPLAPVQTTALAESITGTP